jgi:hypothetical protein
MKITYDSGIELWLTEAIAAAGKQEDSIKAVSLALVRAAQNNCIFPRDLEQAIKTIRQEYGEKS